MQPETDGCWRYKNVVIFVNKGTLDTGLFISPSGISDPCGTVAGMVTPKGSMSTEGETLQVSLLPYRCSICWFLRAPDKRFSHTLDSLGWLPRPASSFRRPQAATLLEFHVQLTNCFVRRWFCAVHGPKPPLHRHNWLSFGKFQDTERFLIHCARHFSSRLPPSGGTFITPRPLVQKKLWEILYLLICSFLPCLSWLLRSRVRKFRRELWITLYSLSEISENCNWPKYVNTLSDCIFALSNIGLGCRYWWSCCLKRRSAATQLLGPLDRIPLKA